MMTYKEARKTPICVHACGFLRFGARLTRLFNYEKEINYISYKYNNF